MTTLKKSFVDNPLPNLDYLGKSRFLSGRKEKERPPDVEMAQLVMKEFPDFNLDEYHHVRPGIERVYNSMKRMNKPLGKSVSSEEFIFVEKALLDLFQYKKFDPVSWEEVANSLEPTQVGVYFRGAIPDKRSGGPILCYWADQLMKTNEYPEIFPLAQVVPKTEILGDKKYHENRCRVYGIMPGEFQCIEMRYFMRLKQYLLGENLGYGMTLQHGGIIKLFKSFRKCELVTMGDWSGHDLNIIYLVCVWLNSFLCERVRASPEEMERLLHYMYYMVVCYMVLGDGEVFRRYWGNMSGRFLTSIISTLCNLIQHLIVYHRTFSKFYVEPSVKEVIFHWNRLRKVFFGDDHVLGGEKNPWNELYMNEEYRKKEFEKVGASLKAGSFVLQKERSDNITFLGFGVNHENEVYFHDPYRVLASLIYRNREKDNLSEILHGQILLFPFNSQMRAFLRAIGARYHITDLPQDHTIFQLWTGYYPECD